MLTDDMPDTPNAPTPDEQLQRERDDFQDRLLRMTAEFDNYRKRTDRERRELSEAAGADLIRDLLPVVDDLERALAAPVDSAAATNYRNGVELIRRQMVEVLRRRGVEPPEVGGIGFDPQWHESVADEPANGRRDGEITAEIRRGYRIGQKLLRAAMVRVAKA